MSKSTCYYPEYVHIAAFILVNLKSSKKTPETYRMFKADFSLKLKSTQIVNCTSHYASFHLFCTRDGVPRAQEQPREYDILYICAVNLEAI